MGCLIYLCYPLYIYIQTKKSIVLFFFVNFFISNLTDDYLNKFDGIVYSAIWYSIFTYYLIQKKDDLILENQKLVTNRFEFNRIIKDQDIVSNQMNTSGANNKLKFILPLLFVLFYLLGYWFSKVYKQQKQRIKA